MHAQRHVCVSPLQAYGTLFSGLCISGDGSVSLRSIIYNLGHVLTGLDGSQMAWMGVQLM